MALYKRGGKWWASFVLDRKRHQFSTKMTNKKHAKDYADGVRVELIRGNIGILAKPLAPTLADFLKNDFLPYVESTHAAKPATLRYYRTGSASLKESSLAGLRLNEISDQHAGQYAARHSNLSASSINCGLRSLRRAVYLACEWGVIERRPKITLAKGERQRDRVLDDAEIRIYLSACEQPWRDVATLMLGTGMRPGEVFALRWERIHLGDNEGMLQIADGKSKAAKRILPLVKPVLRCLQDRWTVQGEPRNGWVFPASSPSGHLEGGSGKNYHSRALAAIRKNADEQGVQIPVEPFPPYTMRHTALTRLAESGCDAFTLARIAGHSSIAITQRYCHPQREAVERAFSKLNSEPLQVRGLLQFPLQSDGAASEVKAANAL